MVLIPPEGLRFACVDQVAIFELLRLHEILHHDWGTDFDFLIERASIFNEAHTLL